MNPQRARRAAPSVPLLVGMAVLLVAGLLATYALGRRAEPWPHADLPASPVEVTASLARGVAWVWPNSNGPKAMQGGAAPYREAAVLLTSLVLRSRIAEHGGRTQPLALPPGVRLVSVVHIEAAADAPSELTPM